MRAHKVGTTYFDLDQILTIKEPQLNTARGVFEIEFLIAHMPHKAVIDFIPDLRDPEFEKYWKSHQGHDTYGSHEYNEDIRTFYGGQAYSFFLQILNAWRNA